LRQTVEYNLREILDELVGREPGITELHLFGSRAYGTGSLRSDCDVLVRAHPGKIVKASNLLEFAMAQCPALDLFLCTETRAVSAANDSFVYASSFDALIMKLDAVKLWTREEGFANFAFLTSGNWKFEVSANLEFAPTVLPDASVAEFSWEHMLKKVEALGLPARPFIGDTLPKAVAQIVEVSRRMVLNDQLGPRGAAKLGWTVNLQSEYDCQNLFFTVFKPWLPGLAREEVTIRFDEQAKISDFSLFEGRLVIEMKFVDGPGKKTEVVKTLDGLSRFYARNANVGTLLFMVFVKQNVQIDTDRWESDYSFATKTPNIITVVIVVP